MRLTRLLPLTSALLFILSGGCAEKLSEPPQPSRVGTQEEPTKPPGYGTSTNEVDVGKIHMFSEGLPSQAYPRELTGEIQPVVRANNEFALELYENLRSQEGNLFLSPYSISAGLAMVCAAARGQTETQMVEVLHLPILTDRSTRPPSTEGLDREQFASIFGTMTRYLMENTVWVDGSELSMANALWGQKGCEFRKEFLDLVKTHYGGHLQKVDFKNAAETARRTINGWVERRTSQKIKELITPEMLDTMTRLVVTNAIYFRCRWAEQFDKERTKEAPFTCADGHQVDALMMNQTAQYSIIETEDFQALELPYVGDKLSMVILLPRKFDGLHELEKRLTLENLSQWLLRLDKRRVAVSIPKFKMTRQFDLVSALGAMGMMDVFSARNADLSGMTGQKELFVSRVIHRAFVDVNEEGTEAAAATVLGTVMAIRPTPPVFRADHPFTFFIRENDSRCILFIGRVMNPQ